MNKSTNGNDRVRYVAYIGMVALIINLILGLMGYSNHTAEISRIKDELMKRQVESNINLAMNYLNSAYGNISIGNETLLDEDGRNIAGRYGVVDAIYKDLGASATIFAKVNDGFRRISTNIRDENGNRAINTFLGKDNPAYEALINGREYVGESSILGDNYYTAYKPIKDVNKNVIGLMFTGTATDEIDSIINVHNQDMNLINTLTIVFRAISLGSLIILVTYLVKITNKEK